MADFVEEAILEQVPESGEVELGQLTAALHNAGNHDIPGQLHRYKSRKVVKYRLEKLASGDYAVMVSRGEGA